MPDVDEPRRGMGWRPDVPDYRDFDLSLGVHVFEQPPDHVRLDLDPSMPTVYDQGSLGSCTANALAAAIEYDLRRQGLPDFMPSRLFIYYEERRLERTIEYDAGAMLRDGAKTLHKIGVCSETTWPYEIGRFAEKPPPEAYEEARGTTAVAYRRVARRDVRTVLAAGLPVVFGFSVYENFWSIGADGIMPLPEGELQGAHAVMLCGYDSLRDRDNDTALFAGGLHYRVRNSWGVGIEDEGYFWMPAEYVHSTRLSSDFWTIQTVS